LNARQQALFETVRSLAGAASPRGLGEDCLFDLTDRSLIEVNGADAADFLQGQLTVDVKALDHDRSRLAAWCSPKGRVLALFRVLVGDSGFWLELPAELAERTLARLRLYVLRARASLDDASPRLLRLGVHGQRVPAVIEGVLGDLPAQAEEVVARAGVTVWRLPGPAPRFELVGEPEAVEPVARALAEATVPAPRAWWSLLDILAGVPLIHADTSDLYLPQMLNLGALGGISFDKGCYVGQEVVARTEHLGRLKRRLYRGRAEAPAPPRGCPVHVARGEPGDPVGRVLCAEAHPEGGSALLAVIAMDAAADPLALESPTGVPLRLEPLPYRV